MDLRPYVEELRHQLEVAAEAGGEDARLLAERLLAPMESAVRLTLQDVLAAAADEITCDLAPGSVELRLRGRDPEFVVTAPPVLEDLLAEPADAPSPVRAPPAEGDEGGMSRINLRMPDQLKARIEDAAAREGLSVNAWLVRAATASLDRTDPGRSQERSASRGSQRFTGWAR
jgi:hypothetical protein